MGTIIDEICEDFSEIVGHMGTSNVMMRRWAKVIMSEIRMAENTCNVLKMEGCTDEEIYDAIDDGLYLSPKIKYYYNDEPKKTFSRKQIMRHNARPMLKYR